MTYANLSDKATGSRLPLKHRNALYPPQLCRSRASEIIPSIPRKFRHRRDTILEDPRQPPRLPTVSHALARPP